MRTDLIFELTVSGAKAQSTSGSQKPLWDMVPFLYIPATRANLPPKGIFDQIIHRPEPYGHDLTWDDILDRHFSSTMGTFFGMYVEDAIDWFRQKLRTNRSQYTQLGKVLSVSYSCAKSICSEVMHGDSPGTYIEMRDEDGEWDDFYGTGRIPHYGMGVVVTKDDTDGLLEDPLYAGALRS